MDTRRKTPPDDQLRSGTAPDTNPDLVELVELQTIGPAGWRNKPVALLVVASAGILAFAAIAVAIKPAAPAPSPSAPAIVLASPAALAPTTNASSGPTAPAPSARPPTPRPTPQPTQAPPWAWQREDILPGLGASPTQMWGVGPRVIVLAQEFGRGWVLARLEPGRDWDSVLPPPAIEDFLGGTVIDERLYLLARVSAVGTGDVTWELVSTTNGDDWESMGASSGLGPVDGLAFMGRAGDRWVAARWRYTGGGGEGAGEMELRWSDDGVRWRAAQLPEMPGDVVFERAAMLGDTMVVIGTNYAPGRKIPFLLVSSDGRTWHKGVVGVPTSYVTTDLACDDTACVLLAEPQGGSETWPLALRTSNFEDWASADIIATADSSGLPTRLTRTDSGFLAIGSGGDQAFSSTDGLTWRSASVVPRSMGEPWLSVAVAGDIVVGLVASTGELPASVWRGSLSALPD